MANYEATKYDFTGGNLTGIEGIPTATIIPWSDSSVPSGFLECNGAAVSRSTYSALFAIVGTSGTKAVASTGGANTVTSTGNVGGSTANASLSTAQLASHSHSSATTPSGPSPHNRRATYNPYRQGSPYKPNTGNAGSGQGHSHNMSANFTGDATSVIQPYLTIVYIIKT